MKIRKEKIPMRIKPRRTIIKQMMRTNLAKWRNG